MRKKIFFILFIGISVFTVVTTSELIFFFRNERTRLIDQQVEVLATSILSTDITESRFDEVQSQVSRALGTRSTVAFLSIYDRYQNLRFRNPNAQILFETKVIEPREKWMTINYGEHKVRILNLRTAAGSWIQVGMLIDQENAEWDSIAARAFLIGAALLIAVAFASFFLSRLLLRPLSELATDLRNFSQDLDNRKTSEQIFSKWSKQTRATDAFGELVKSLVDMRSRLVDKLKMNDATLSHMAHELKTPLAVIRAGTESLLIDATSQTDKEHLEELLNEADRLSDTITSFLLWSRFHQIEFQKLNKSFFSLGEVLSDVVSGLEHLYPGRLKVNIEYAKIVEEHKPHVEQVIRNVLSNALKYSLAPVEVTLQKERLVVVDHGAGIPEKILSRLGEPFNSGSPAGTGLGLAWVKTLCTQHGWSLKVESSGQGTHIELRFKEAAG